MSKFVCTRGDDSDDGSAIFAGTLVSGHYHKGLATPRYFKIDEVLDNNHATYGSLCKGAGFPMDGGIWVWAEIVKPTRNILRAIKRAARKQKRKT